MSGGIGVVVVSHDSAEDLPACLAALVAASGIEQIVVVDNASRDASKEIVGFAFDRRDRLIGCAEHPGAHLTDRDLRLYIEMLARECDQMEFLLTGEDRA